MAVDGVSLAASIAGLLSLGLQITGGIIKYLDAFKDREDELAYLKQQNDALTTTLLAVDTTTSSFQGQHSKFTSAVIQNIQSCKKELGAVEALRVNLADCGKSSWVTGLKNKKKKLTYAFHRPKIQQLAHRLQEANEALQLTLNGLELEISWSNTNKLTAIQSSSQTHTSELVLLRSKVEVVEAPITSIHNRLPLLQDSVESTAQLVGGITNEIQASSQAIQQGLQQSHDLIQIQFRQQQERLGKLEGLLEKLQPQDERNQPKHTLAARVASKPAALKELCDGILAPNKRHDRDIPLDQAACESQNRVASPLHNSQYTSNTNTICICCHRPHRLTSRTEIHLGHVYLYSEWESKGHWPGCPLSKTARKSRRAFNLKYTGLIRMVELAIGASFMWTSGAGGFSISPNFTYYPTVDRTSDPAFRIMSMMGYSWAYCLTKNKKPFMVACLRKLVKLFDDKKACPLAVDNWNHSLMREAADALLLGSASHKIDSSGRGFFLELIQMLLSFGVSAFTYDNRGFSPLLNVGLHDVDLIYEVVNMFVQTNLEHQPASLGASPDEILWMNEMTINSILLCDMCHGFAEASEYGPLSMAIAQNDANKVTDILRRFPGSLAELNIYGQSPLHLAAAKPQILRLLVEAANLSLLSQIDGIGFTALETAMLLSGTQCMNKSNLSRCRQCACTQCVEILLEAGCSARMHTNERLRGPLSLGKILSPVSELARRRYIYHMKELRDYQLRQFPSDQLLSTKRRVGKTDTTPPQKGSEMYNRNNEEVWSWVYNELDDPHHAELFYRHGFRPHLSLFIHLQQRSITYTSWLVEHSADLFPRSPDGPHLIENSPNTGVISVRYVFYILGHRITRLSSAAFERLGLAVRRRNLTDGCRCNCSTIGCNPFIWMMKGMMERGGKYNAERYASHMFDYFSKCDHQLIALTYTAAIRIATFQALGLTHTCCNPPNAAEGDDDVDNINEEQASLLEFHEELVVEFEKEALKFINYEHDGCQSFPDFWMTCWIARVKEVLDKLDGDKLTDEERKGAEDIGVRWCEPVLEKQKRPYNIRSLEYYMHELDLIFPEYNQPWPEDLNQNLS